MRHLVPLLSVAAGLLGAGELAFREHTIAADLAGGYHVVAADVNRDGRPDLIALASRTPDLVWFENPGWQRHVIARPPGAMINLALLNGDIVVASGWSNVARNSPGNVSVLRAPADPRQTWSITEIDRIPTAHRLRTARLRRGPAVINAPLIGKESVAPHYTAPVPLVLYRPPDWRRVMVGSETRGVVHGLTVVDWDGDGFDELLTASFEGVHLYREDGRGRWFRQKLLAGDPAPWPKSGASEVAVGRSGRTRFLVTVEPWHGNQIAVYTETRGGWQRNVVEGAEPDIHGIYTADINSDGADEIIAAVRGPSKRVLIYTARGGEWQRQVIDDGGIAAASCAIVDLNRDGRPDLACIGAATQNLKWYENLGSATAASP